MDTSGHDCLQSLIAFCIQWQQIIYSIPRRCKSDFMRLFPSLFRLPNKLRRRVRRYRLATLILVATILFLLSSPFWLAYIVYKPPNALIRYFQHRWPDVIWQVQTSKKVVALTIDDAPSQYTDEIRSILQANSAKATFFLIGSQTEGREREEILHSLVKDGHELGNHAMHDEPSRSLSDEVLTNELKTVQQKIHDTYAVIGRDQPPAYFRPGSGFFSTRLRALVDKLGFKLVLGSIYPHDPQISYWSVNARHILSMVRPGGLIICHDRRSWTPPMLKTVLPELKRRGYSVVTLTELLAEAEG